MSHNDEPTHPHDLRRPDLAARILLVNDGTAIIEALFAFLKGEGYHVDIADGLQAVGMLLANSHYQLLFIDVSSGLTLFRTIRQERPGVVMLAITDYNAVHLGEEAVHAGALAYLAKPLIDDELCTAIQTAMQHTPLSVDELRARRLGLEATLEHGPRWAHRRLNSQLRQPPGRA